MSCAARKKNAAESDRSFRGWADDDSGDGEMTRGGGDWYNKGTDFVSALIKGFAFTFPNDCFLGRVVCGVGGMVLVVGLAFAALSLKRNVLSIHATINLLHSFSIFLLQLFV